MGKIVFENSEKLVKKQTFEHADYHDFDARIKVKDFPIASASTSLKHLVESVMQDMTSVFMRMYEFENTISQF